MITKKSKILIACEESQTVCLAFRSLGYKAWSCDVQAPSGNMPQYHIKGDCIPHAYSGAYDLMIAHPPCTYLATSGSRWLYRDGKFDQDRYEKGMKALEFVRQLMNAPIKHICIENPISIISSYIKKPTQIIHPYQHGHLEEKKTCLWLKNLPRIKPTNNVYEEMIQLPKSKRQRIVYMGSRNKKLRSVSYRGIADAMADQWTRHHYEQLELPF
jgi:hypothetical protein